MKKRIITLIIITILIVIPATVLGENIKSIVIIVDEMSLDTVERLEIDNPSIGFMNLKTRGKYSEDSLYLSINKGRKLNKKTFKKESDSNFLGDVLEDEKPSHIGEGKEGSILWNSDEKLAYDQNNITYDSDWLIKNTNNIMEDSNILTLGYDFKNEEDRIRILKEYLSYYDEEQIIIIPKTISKGDRTLLNKSLVPIVHINNEESGLLTSSSTKRDGFITIEDISVQLKNTYGHFNKIDIGNNFKNIIKEDPIKETNHIYKVIMNLLIITYICHGFFYLSQGILGVSILKYKKIKKWAYFTYNLAITNICVSLIFGLFEIHQNLFIYLIIGSLLSYIIVKKTEDNKRNSIEPVILSTYGLIVFGTLVYPKMIYNSYIGFNNLVYGARYYGLNNGIMGVLLVTSVLSFFIVSKRTKNINLKKIIGIFIFGLNIVILSTKFGTNTGGFIVSIILFLSMIYIAFFSEKGTFKGKILFLLIGISLFGLNMIVDNIGGDRSHAIEFFYRLKENRLTELIYMVSFKAKELITLTLTPPFSIVLILQGIILKKLNDNFIKDKKIKQHGIMIIMIALIGFIINDTGMIMLIYMLSYLMAYIINISRKSLS